ncbi:MAG: ATP synthase subunit I [Propionivibrio sp.]|nr:ATP synthase subunit I [Propionivibrio sp.]
MITMFRTVFLQVAVTVMAMVVAGIVVGTRGAVSAAIGGLVCAIPNLLFATHLGLSKFRSGASFAGAFLLGEFVKLVLTVSMLVVVAKYYTDLHWPSLLIGLVLATQVLFLAFWKKN